MEPERNIEGRLFLVRRVLTNEQAATHKAYMCPQDYLSFVANLAQDTVTVRLTIANGIVHNLELAVDDNVPAGTIALGGPDRTQLGLSLDDVVRVTVFK